MFYYDKKLAETIHALMADEMFASGLVPMPDTTGDNHFPLQVVHYCLTEFPKILGTDARLQSFLQEHTASKVFYYLLMLTRKLCPKFFPVHDLCLLLANVLCEQGQEKPMEILLLDVELLPVAVLLAEGKAKIHLPSEIVKNSYAQKICCHLRNFLTNAGWVILDNYPQNFNILSQKPLCISEGDLDLDTIAGGVVLVNWDFLGLRIYSHARRQWLESGLVRHVLQLPRPRRQSVAIYPALLCLEKGIHDNISMAQPESSGIGSGIGPGSLDMDATVELLAGATTVSTKSLLHSEMCTLTPAIYLHEKKEESTEDVVPLRQVAHVLRCQIPRKPFDFAKWSRFEQDTRNPVYDSSGKHVVGMQSTMHTTYYKEMGLADIDPISGFVDMFGGQNVSMEIKSMGKQGKYLLQLNDIVMIFRGSMESIGKVGFVDDILEERSMIGGSIAGKSMFIIRPFAMDAAWLFSYLRQGFVRKDLANYASGASVLTITIENVKNMLIPVPSSQELQRTQAIHQEISANMEKIQELYRNIAHNWHILQASNEW